jgi:hypothetical protein
VDRLVAGEGHGDRVHGFRGITIIR